MRKIIISILSIILCLSFVVGCEVKPDDPITPAPSPSGSGSGSNSGSNSGSGSVVPPDYFDAVYPPEETPVVPAETLTLSDKGATEYKIVIPENPSELVEYAGKELKLYFDAAAGTNIQIVTDAGLTYSESEGKYLSVGETAIKSATNVDADYAELDRDGFVIKTVGDDYVMCGGGDYGTLYSVYEFLHRAFGWETYAADEIYWEETSKAEVEKMDVVDVPAFKNRTGGYFEGRTDAYFTAKLRTFANYGVGLFGEDLFGIWGHSHYKIMRGEGLAAGTYTNYSETKYPQYYGGAQLCYSADGIVEDFAKNLAEYVWQMPKQIYFMMGQLDNNNPCTCPNCTAYAKLYNGDDPTIKNRGFSVLMMEFFNGVCKEVNKIVREKYVAEYGEEVGNKKADARINEIRIVTFAYFYSIEPPVEYNSTTGKYEPMTVNRLSTEETTEAGDFSIGDKNYKIIKGEEISTKTATDNAMIMIAPLGVDFDYYHPISDEKYNTKGRYIVEGWNVVSPKVVGYLYGNNFSRYAEWFDDFSSLPENFRYYAELGGEAGWAFSENSSGAKGSVSFQALRSYVYSKLQWNPDLELDELCDDFMNNYYKIAAPQLKEYFEYCRMYYASKMHDAEIERDESGKMYTTHIFSDTYSDYATLLQMGNILNNALVAIENSSYDEMQKIKLTNRVLLETITVRFTLIHYYSKYIADSVYLEFVDSFIEDCKALEVYGKPETEWDAQRESWLRQKGLIA